VADRRNRRRALAKLIRSGSMSAAVAAADIREEIAWWTRR
jgi:hypothetical protein